jgi:hypothetical protein
VGHEKVLIVEGVDDKGCVIGLMRNYIEWPTREPWPVLIKHAGGASEVLKPAFLSTQLKERGVRIVGIMLDADANPSGRYQSIRNTCSRLLFSLPETLPAGGGIAQNQGGMKVGIWIMPDNSSEGYIETFLRYLVPDKEEPIWQHAINSVESAKRLGAQYPDKDIPKAHLFTWLAWQSVPGQQPGIALTKHILNPDSPHAAPFVKWFRDLFEV